MLLPMIVVVLQSTVFAAPKTTTLLVDVKSSASWVEYCQQVDVTFATDTNTPSSSGAFRTVKLTTNLGGLFVDSKCTKSFKQYRTLPSTKMFRVYFKTSKMGDVEVIATAKKLKPGKKMFAVTKATAEVVLGQPAMNFHSANYPSLSAQSFQNPNNVSIAAGKMFVADYINHRVLVWNTIPTNTQQAADFVLGQPDMSTNSCNTNSLSASSLCGPAFVFSDGKRLVVADEENSRVLIWNTLPTYTQQPADVVLGQPDMFSNEDYYATPAANTLFYPGGVYIANNKLFVVDSADNRILIWNTFPNSNQKPADVVVGQTTMTSNSASTSQSTLNYPYIVTVSGTKMFVSDFGNSRILIWNTIPTSNGAAANVVLGQPDFTSFGPNSGGLSARSLSEAGTPMSDAQGRFYVADFSNNRILIWNEIPTANYQAANAVLGQPNFTTNSQNTGGVSATSCYNPWGLLENDGKLWVAEFGNHRVLQYTIPY